MSFSRALPRLLDAAELDTAMRGIGMQIGSRGAVGPHAADLEQTLVSVAALALPGDFRLLGVLLAWLEVHHARVNVPRLGRFVEAWSGRALERAWWAAVGAWLGRADARWRALTKLYAGARLELDDAEVTALQIQRHGEDARFVDTPLRVAAKLLRSRASDVQGPLQLAAHHPLYFRRVQLGPNYRADVWAALDRSPEASPAEIARVVGCAYETARAVAQDWTLARSAERRESASSRPS